MRSYYNLAIAMKGVTSLMGIVAGGETIRQYVQYNDILMAVLGMALIPISIGMYKLADKLQKREVCAEENKIKTLENKLAPTIIPAPQGYVPGELFGSRGQWHNPVYDKQDTKKNYGAGK